MTANSLSLRDRRGDVRAAVDGVAHLIVEDAIEGPYAIENLSAGGVLVSGMAARKMPRQVRLLLDLPGQDPLSVAARMLRRLQGSAAFAFERLEPDTEDMIQEVVLTHLEAPGGPHVLVVEPERHSRRVLLRDLAKLGCRLKSVAGIEAARELMGNWQFKVDVLVVELNLGDADGQQLLEAVAKERPQARRVLMSGEIRPAQLRLALLQRRAEAVLSKPWDVQQLRAAIGPWIDGRRYRIA